MNLMTNPPMTDEATETYSKFLNYIEKNLNI